MPHRSFRELMTLQDWIVSNHSRVFTDIHMFVHVTAYAHCVSARAVQGVSNPISGIPVTCLRQHQSLTLKIELLCLCGFARLQNYGADTAQHRTSEAS